MAAVKTVFGKSKEGNKTGKILISRIQHNLDTESVFAWRQLPSSGQNIGSLTSGM